jgi:hypothetical protein
LQPISVLFQVLLFAHCCARRSSATHTFSALHVGACSLSHCSLHCPAAVGVQVLTIGATNLAQELDQALLRPGRFEVRGTLANTNLKPSKACKIQFTHEHMRMSFTPRTLRGERHSCIRNCNTQQGMQDSFHPLTLADVFQTQDASR